MKPPSLTIGIEEEYQIINPETGELTSYITEILESDHVVLREQMKPELHQSVVEVGSVVCKTAAEARQEVIRLRRLVSEKVAEKGLRIAAAGTHPFSSWLEQEITPLERYLGIHEDLREIAQKNLVFGMHVHIGVEDREFVMDAMNVARYFLPHLLALSTSSPF
ncbi:MAG: glutamate-cysteine ligase family protein, partial [Gemmatimonadota bacterium]